VRRDEIQAKWVANQIALKRAIEKTGASKIITFHSRVNLAEDFAGDDARGFKEHVKGFDVFHVNGSQNAADRKALLEGFKAAPKGLITNARCLTEGVDVPAVDMVAFVDPRKSKIDIAQAAGRAMRQSKATNKKLGYIVVPLFIEQKKGETEAEAFTRAGFDEVAEVLGAMLESDDDLVDTIEKMQEARGRGDKFNPRQLHEKIEVIGPAINLDKLTRSIDVEILDCLGFSWDKWFGLLKRFKKREGHCLVPQRFTLNNLNLGAWVGAQRKIKTSLSIDRVSRLDSIGFSWDPITEQWEEAYNSLKKFRKEEGHCRVDRDYKVGKLRLGAWVSNQRGKKDELSTERIARLDEIGFRWDTLEDNWEENFVALKSFQEREGHCRVPQPRGGGNKLGVWVGTQRLRMKAKKLAPERVAKLKSIGFIWDKQEDEWEAKFAALSSFQKKEGHCRVDRGLIFRGIKLGVWIRNLRLKKAFLTAGQIRRLNSLGFSWDPLGEQWEQAYAELLSFHKREGHCRVVNTHLSNGLRLGRWVSTQRAIKKSLTPEKVRRLNSLGFTWDPHSEQWEQAYAELVKFHKQEGHSNVTRFTIYGGIKLGQWVSSQRAYKSRLTPERIKRLNSLDFCWDPSIEKWGQAFALLRNFHKREGHCRVPRSYSVGGVNLGKWISLQRLNKERLNKPQISRLNSLGFSWDPLGEQWEQAYAALKKFQKREGHCRVQAQHKENGINLGNWVNNTRYKKSQHSADRLRRLNSLGFIW
jgi:hypothetical protein